MHAPHTTCPGCREEVYLDELVRGRCPLCGCTLEDFEAQEGELEDFIERSDLPWLVFNYFLFKRFLEIGASPLQIMQTRCSVQRPGPPGQRAEAGYPLRHGSADEATDRIRPKRCAKCGKIFFGKGRKVAAGDLAAPGLEYLYYCKGC